MRSEYIRVRIEARVESGGEGCWALDRWHKELVCGRWECYSSMESAVGVGKFLSASLSVSDYSMILR